MIQTGCYTFSAPGGIKLIALTVNPFNIKLEKEVAASHHRSMCLLRGADQGADVDQLSHHQDPAEKSTIPSTHWSYTR